MELTDAVALLTGANRESGAAIVGALAAAGSRSWLRGSWFHPGGDPLRAVSVGDPRPTRTADPGPCDRPRPRWAASWTSRSGTPASSAAVMNACRNAWGVTALPIPARRAALRTIRPAP